MVMIPTYLTCFLLGASVLQYQTRQDATRDSRAYGKAMKEILLSANSKNPDLLAMEGWIQKANRTSDKFSMQLVQSPGKNFLGAQSTGQTVQNKTEVTTFLSLAPAFENHLLKIEEKTQWSERVQFKIALLVLIITALPFLICILVFQVLGKKHLIMPLQNLYELSRKLSQGTIEETYPKTGDDEVGSIFQNLVELSQKLRNSHLVLQKESSDRKYLEESLKQENRLSSLGRLSTGLAHELGTPLHVVLGYARLLQGNQMEDSKKLYAAKIIEEQVHRMSTLIKGILDFSKPRTLQPEEISASALITKALRLGISSQQREKMVINSQGDNQTRFQGDETLLLQVLINLIQNAIEAMKESSNPLLKIRWGSLGEDRVFFELEDNGIGMSEEELQNIFEPFYSTRKDGMGTGLGLSIAYGIVKEHRGRLIVSSEKDKGSRFVLELPRE